MWARGCSGGCSEGCSGGVVGVVVASALDFRPEGSFMLFPLTKKTLLHIVSLHPGV